MSETFALDLRPAIRFMVLGVWLAATAAFVPHTGVRTRSAARPASATPLMMEPTAAIIRDLAALPTMYGLMSLNGEASWDLNTTVPMRS